MPGNVIVSSSSASSSGSTTSGDDDLLTHRTLRHRDPRSYRHLSPSRSPYQGNFSHHVSSLAHNLHAKHRIMRLSSLKQTCYKLYPVTFLLKWLTVVTLFYKVAFFFNFRKTSWEYPKRYFLLSVVLQKQVSLMIYLLEH